MVADRGWKYTHCVFELGAHIHEAPPACLWDLFEAYNRTEESGDHGESKMDRDTLNEIVYYGSRCYCIYDDIASFQP
jgi:hypothetical protein